MELLAPAGTLEKLKWAVIYGADAVYFGMEFGSLRNFAGISRLRRPGRDLHFCMPGAKRLCHPQYLSLFR